MTFEFLGSGIKFPFQFDQHTGGIAESSTHDHIHESIFQILGTNIGERFMRPDFGSKLDRLIFEKNDHVLRGLIRHYVIDAIRKWEKRVIITDVAFDDSPQYKDQNMLPVQISYRVIQTQMQGNLVYPFYRDGRNATG